MTSLLQLGGHELELTVAKKGVLQVARMQTVELPRAEGEGWASRRQRRQINEPAAYARKRTASSDRRAMPSPPDRRP